MPRVHHALCAFVVLALLSLTGCPPPPDDGDDNPPSGLGPGPDKSGSGGSSTTARTEYRFPLPDDAKTLDPAQLTDTVSDAVARKIFSTLIKFNPDGEIEHDLAEAYTVSDDKLTYTFKLRSGVRFHNGDALTAEDVVFTLRRILDPATNAKRANLLEKVVGADEFSTGKTTELPGLSAPDESTVVIKLSSPYMPFINALCMTSFGIVPQKVLAVNAAGFGDRPVGSGPFVFESWERDNKITLKANRDYYDQVPHIQTLVYRVIKDENTRFEEFKSGALEHCDIPPSQIKNVMGDEKLKALVTGRAAMDMYGYGFNCSKAPFKDNPNLRLALNHAVDRANIINNIWAGLVTEQKTIVPQGMFYFNGDSQGYAYDVEKAKQLLEAAGYPGGAGLPELVLNVDLQPTNKLVAQAVQADLAKVGVKIRIETTAWGPFLDKVYAGEALFHQNTWLTDYPDPDNWLYQLLCSDNFGDGGNITRWSNSQFDLLVKEAQTTTDQTRRSELYKQAEDIALSEAPWLPLFWKNSSTLVQPYVRGLEVSRLDRTPQLNNVPLETITLE